MGIINWLMHRNMRRQAEALAKWATESYQSVRTQNSDLSDRDVFGKMLDQRARFPGSEKDRETVLDRYGSSLHGLCYYIGLNSQDMKRMMVSRCVQFTDYVDIELEKYGFKKPSDEIKRRYFKTLGLPANTVTSLNPKNLPEELLVQALFENAILQAQNFVGRLKKDKQLSAETQNKLVSQIVEYAFSIMVFYLQSAGKGGLQQKVMQKHETFLMDNCGTNNSEVRAQFLEAWRQEIKRKVQWLSLGNNTTNLDNNCFAQNIISDSSFDTDINNNELLPYVEQFVSDVALSMKHFGISG